MLALSQAGGVIRKASHRDLLIEDNAEKRKEVIEIHHLHCPDT